MDPKIVTFDVALKSTERQLVQKIPEVYTNDLHSVSLQFRITDCTDTELTGSTAIVLLKMRDGSFFQRPSVDVKRTLNVFSYTLKENEGNHDGLAEIQLVVTIDTKDFATQKYNFKVISGLDSEVAREIMIYEWSTLTAEARAYIDQFAANEILREAEFDNNEFDRNVAFNAAQGQRATDFGLAQTQRNTDFVTDQAQRVDAFNAAEAARVLAFNNAETARAAGYDADHSRAETDHTGATTDRTNAATDRTNAATDRTNAAADRTLAGTDHTRAEADHTRADADNATVAGFNTRLSAEETATANNKISTVKSKTFADVDARFEDVETDTTMMATNLIVGGQTFQTTGYANAITSKFNQKNFIMGEKHYFSALYSKVSGVENIASGEIRITQPVDITILSAKLKKSNVYTFLQSVDAIQILAYGPNVNTGSGTVANWSNFIHINLTKTFGAGNEPTVEQMDAIMAKFENSWFDGTKNLFQAKASFKKLMALDARTEFDVKNGIINGNFSNGTMGWSASATLTPLGNGKVNLAPTGVSAYVEPSNLTTIPAKNGNKIYMASYIKSSPDATSEKLMITAGITQILLVNNKPLTNTSGALVSAITTLSGQTDGRMITAYVSNAFASAEIAGSSSYSFGYVTLVDLTATFGAGKEPTLAEMDRLMARYPNSWFDGTKPIQTIETLYQEKANKTQEAWITPTLINGWVVQSGFPVGYRMDEFGDVRFRGRVSRVGGVATMFTLPSSYRPLVNALCLGIGDSGGGSANNLFRIQAETLSGNVYPREYSTGVVIDLSRFEFNRT